MKRTYIVRDQQMNIRLEGIDKALIERAARKIRKRPSAFVRDAALEAAHMATMKARNYRPLGEAK